MSASFAKYESGEFSLMDLKTTIVNGVQGIKDTISAIAPLFIAIGFLGAGIMYACAHMPFMADWKQKHPNVLTNVMIGFLIFAAVPVITSMIPAG